jgi:CO/xanthine dehydrogenase Mo-binding subunit
MSTEFKIIGTRQPKIDAFERVSGRARYTSDVTLPGMLHLKVLRSPYPHAQVRNIDVGKALSLSGVKAILTHKDMPAFRWHPEMPVLTDVARFVGDDIAVVAAVDEETALEALDLIKVDYQVLPFVLDAEEALKPGAPKLFPEGNLFGGKPVTVSRGDVEKGFRDADLVYERKYNTNLLQHATREPRVCVAQWEAGKLTAWDSTQCTFDVQKGLAQALRIPISKVRVICDFMGGGFGDRSTAERYDVLAALVARKTGRPARIEFDREESFLAGHHRYPVTFYLKYGVKNDGTLIAIQAKAVADMGGYPHFGGAVGSMEVILTSYRCPNLKTESYSVCTNKPEGGFMRCVGHPQATFPQEVHMDAIAEKLGMDPVEFRLKNHARLEDGNQDRKIPFSSNGMAECIKKGAEAFKWKEKWQKPLSSTGPIKKGFGMALHTCRHGAMAPGMPSSGMVRVNVDGTVNVFTGTADLGGGQKGTMAMIAAEAIGVPLDSVFVTSADTDVTTDTAGTTGSRQTITGGTGIILAAKDAKNQLLDIAAAELKKDKKDITISEGRVYVAGSQTAIPLGDIARKAPGPIMGRGVGKAPTNVVVHTFATHFAEVEVDTRTGAVRVVQLVAVHDMGRAINVMATENQIEGGATQGIGFCLSEEQIMDRATGICVNPSYLDYKVATIKDVPEIVPVMVESIEPTGPFGAKGIGEPPYSAAAPAITNAIYNAIGVRFSEIPINNRSILASLAKSKA